VFGLLIPELGQTEIFEAICKGMMEAQEAMHHSLLWGNTVSQEQEKEQAAEQLCEQYLSQKVSGVFFAPVEFSANRFQSNHKIRLSIELAFPWCCWTGISNLIRSEANTT
jgi:DNA-binding LacI/PurR family transcriptional regulator